MSASFVEAEDMPEELSGLHVDLASEDPDAKNQRVIDTIRWWLDNAPLKALPITVDGRALLCVSFEAAALALDHEDPTEGAQP